MSTDTATMHDSVERYVRQSYRYSDWHFENEASENGWESIGIMLDALDSPITAHPESRWYSDTCRYACDLSNWEVIQEVLDNVDMVEGYPTWSMGPGDTVVYDASNPAVVAAVESIEGALASYGFLNETRCSEIEYEENHPSETECYSDNPDCGCPVKSHECGEEFRNVMEAEGFSALFEDEWYCQYCSEWYEVTAKQADWLAQWQIRHDNAERERLGQLVLIVLPLA